MSFNTSQPSFQDLRDTLAISSAPVLVFSGSGLSQPKGLPSWKSLQLELLDAARRSADSFETKEKMRILGYVDAAESESNLWESFNLLKKGMGNTSFAAAILKAFRCADGPFPEIYEELWSLRIEGHLTLNIDRFAGRSFKQIAQPLTEFKGKDSINYMGVLNGGKKFVANLHGVLDDQSSWVFTKDDLDGILRQSGFNEFLTSCYITRRIVFIGISADDVAAGGFLLKLRQSGIPSGNHFWITDRNDKATKDWAESVGVQLIIYSNSDGQHSELREAISHLKRHKPVDDVPHPVIPAGRRHRNFVLPTPEELKSRSAQDIREILNKKAVNILLSEDPNKESVYKTFLNDYAESVYRSRWVSCKEGENAFFEYKLISKIREGGFGEVYSATDPKGAKVALKLLHHHNIGNESKLDGFRRGVHAMDILKKHGVPNVVPYVSSWEIPAAVVMELVEGANLEEGVDWGWIEEVGEKLEIVRSLVETIRKSHQVPEKVLHRDIKPSNIMVRRNADGKWDVVVLDFDLSWHNEAIGASVPLEGTVYGYVAPELVGFNDKAFTRSALVDSFGIGMTMYFLFSGGHPRFGAQALRSWKSDLDSKIAALPCRKWKSLPARIARLIDNSTLDDQGKRWDLSRIYNEISLLLDAINSQAFPNSVELVCEEMAAMCVSLESYSWDDQLFCAELELPTGFCAQLKADALTQKITCVLEWRNTGEMKFESVRKYAPTATGNCSAEFQKCGWKVLEKVSRYDGCRVIAEIDLREIVTRSRLEVVSKSIDSAVRCLRFG